MQINIQNHPGSFGGTIARVITDRIVEIEWRDQAAHHGAVVDVLLGGDRKPIAAIVRAKADPGSASPVTDVCISDEAPVISWYENGQRRFVFIPKVACNSLREFQMRAYPTEWAEFVEKIEVAFQSLNRNYRTPVQEHQNVN